MPPMNPTHPHNPARPQGPQQAPFAPQQVMGPLAPQQAHAPSPFQSVTAHLNDLVSREQYPLLHAAEFVLATLDTAVVITRAKFPEINPMAPHYASTVLAVQTRLVQVLPTPDEDDEEGAPAGAAPQPTFAGR